MQNMQWFLMSPEYFAQKLEPKPEYSGFSSSDESEEPSYSTISIVACVAENLALTLALEAYPEISDSNTADTSCCRRHGTPFNVACAYAKTTKRPVINVKRFTHFVASFLNILGLFYLETPC